MLGITVIALVHAVGIGIVTKFLRIGKKSKDSPETDGMTIHWARWYDPFVQLVSLGRAKKLRQLTLDLAQIKTGESVLDVGCGTGQLVALMQEKGIDVIGIDASAEMIQVAQQKHPTADFRLAAIENLPFEDNTFDVIVSSLTLHHLPPPLQHVGPR